MDNDNHKPGSGVVFMAHAFWMTKYAILEGNLLGMAFWWPAHGLRDLDVWFMVLDDCAHVMGLLRTVQ